MRIMTTRNRIHKQRRLKAGDVVEVNHKHVSGA